MVDDDGAEVPRGEPGEIVVRGYNVMQGYFEDPEQTAEAIDADGWLHTGDIGTMDADGYVAITDRKKDMFIVGGFNAYPAEIERLLLTHPRRRPGRGGRRARRADGRGGHGLRRAHRRRRPLDPDELVAWAREHMANYKAPRHVRVRRRAADERQQQGAQDRAAGAGQRYT